jgi:hypothetical protein
MYEALGGTRVLVKQNRTTPSDHLAAFRLPTEMLKAIDLLCSKLDLSRSQLIRRCISEYIAIHNETPNRPN